MQSRYSNTDNKSKHVLYKGNKYIGITVTLQEEIQHLLKLKDIMMHEKKLKKIQKITLFPKQ